MRFYLKVNSFSSFGTLIQLVFLITMYWYSDSLSAQELLAPVRNQYIAENYYQISSAYAGIGECWQFRATGLEQWVNVPNSPGTQQLTLNGRIADRSGVGINLFNDKNGNTSHKGVQISYAHHLVISESNKQYLSLGLSYRYLQFAINTTNLTQSNLVPIPVVPESVSIGHSNFDISVLYRVEDFYASLNAVNLFRRTVLLYNNTEPISTQHLYLHMGYVFKSYRYDMEYEPNILAQTYTSDMRTIVDLNLKVRKKIDKRDYLWGGFSYRSLGDQNFKPLSISPMLGIKKKKFYIAYAYELNLNESLDFSTSDGTHLLTLGFDFICRDSKCGCTY